MGRQIVVRPLGLVTEPNKVGQYPPGALAEATRARIRSPGVIEAARRYRPFLVNEVGPCTYAICDQRHSVFLTRRTLGSWYLLWYGGSGLTSTVDLTTYNSWFTEDGRVGLMIIRNRLIITTAVRTFVIDLHRSPGSPVPNPRLAGSPQPQISQGSGGRTIAVTTTEKGIVNQQKHVTCVAVLTMVASDGYELASVPSAPIDLANLDFATQYAIISYDHYVVSNVPYTTDVTYTIELYRSREQSLNYNESTFRYAPTSTGANTYLATSTARTGTFTLVTDTTLEVGLGKALFTNTAVQGAAALPLPPPPAKCSAAYKGHAFYGNRFDCAQVTLQVPFYWGGMGNDIPRSTAERGVGNRTFTNCVTAAASAVITDMDQTHGVVAGQRVGVYLTGSSGTFFGTVVSKTATTVTLNAATGITGPCFLYVWDRLEVNSIDADTSLYGATAIAADLTSNPFGDPLIVWCNALEPASASVADYQFPTPQPVGGLTFRARDTSPILLRGTNGQNYSPKLPGITQTAKRWDGKWQPNVVCWSEQNQPENCPAGNYLFVGNGEIYQLVPTRDCLWVFCSDGLYRISGSGGSVGDGYDWAVDPVDLTLVLAAPRACCVHRDTVYAYTNRGFVSITSEGLVTELSDGRIGDVLPGATWAAPTINENTVTWMEADAAFDEIILRLPSGNWWIYNVKTDCFTSGAPSNISSPVAAAYSTRDQRLLVVDSIAGRVCDGAGTSYEAMNLRYQPLFGSDPYNHKHWQSIDVTIDGNQASGLQLTFTPNGKAALAATRTVPVTATASEDESRVGFMVPRNAPASANALTIGLSINEVATATKLQSLSVALAEFSDQRRRR
jgi:hypothetical protein